MGVIKTKLLIPENQQDYISRKRLLQKLDVGLLKKITVITAHAGCGKTALLSEWASTLTSEPVWVALDFEDNIGSGERFWKHNITALHKKLGLPFDILFDQSAFKERSFLVKLLNMLSKVEEEIVIIWDDFQVIKNEVLLRNLSYFIRYLPPNVHLYISSRQHPDLSLSRIKMEDNIIELTADHLMLTEIEKNHLMEGLLKIPLTKELESMFDLAEGWIMGIKLLAYRFNQQKFRSKIDHLIGKDKNLQNYFLEEVMNNLDEQMKQFLLKTAMFNSFSEEFCEEIIENGNGRLFLYELIEHQLFIVPIENGWYRYHHLFRDFLIEHQQLIYEREKIVQIYCRAAQWFESQSYEIEALEYYLAGEEYEQSLKILLKQFNDFNEKEKEVSLKAFIKKIPNEILIQDSRLYIVNLIVLNLLGDEKAWKEGSRWAREYIKMRKKLVSKSELAILSGGIAFLHAFDSYLKEDLERAIYWSREYLTYYPQGGLFQNMPHDGGLYYSLLELKTFSNDLFRYEENLLTLIDLWQNTSDVHFYSLICLDYGYLLIEWNDLENAQKHFQIVKEIGETYQIPYLEVIATIHLTHIYRMRYYIEQEIYLLSSLKALETSQLDHFLQTKLNVFFEMYPVEERGIAIDQTWFDKLIQIEDVQVIQQRIFEYRFVIRRLTQDDKLQQANQLVEKLLSYQEMKNVHYYFISLLLQKSILLERKGERINSLYTVETALYLAQEYQYIRVFLDEEKWGYKVLKNYLEIRNERKFTNLKNVSLIYVRKLLQLFPYEQSVTPKKVTDKLYGLTDREKEVLDKLSQGLSYGDIGFYLEIAPSTVKTHVNNVFRKLQVNNRVQAAQKAKKLKLI